MNGLQVDVRAPHRRSPDRVTRFQRDQYDKAATTELIAIFHSHPLVKSVLFNDTDIPFVQPGKAMTTIFTSTCG